MRVLSLLLVLALSPLPAYAAVIQSPNVQVNKAQLGFPRVQKHRVDVAAARARYRALRKQLQVSPRRNNDYWYRNQVPLVMPTSKKISLRERVKLRRKRRREARPLGEAVIIFRP